MPTKFSDNKDRLTESQRERQTGRVRRGGESQDFSTTSREPEVIDLDAVLVGASPSLKTSKTNQTSSKETFCTSGSLRRNAIR